MPFCLGSPPISDNVSCQVQYIPDHKGIEYHICDSLNNTDRLSAFSLHLKESYGSLMHSRGKNSPEFQQDVHQYLAL